MEENEVIYWNKEGKIVPIQVDKQLVVEIIERHRSREAGVMNMTIGGENYEGIDVNNLLIKQ